MIVTKMLLSSMLLVILNLRIIQGHGMLMEPVNRSSAWRKGFITPLNYDDNGLNCGGGFGHDPLHGGRCGECGDPYKLKRPRPNENGGIYGTGLIVKRYKAGQIMPIEFKLTANHKGSCTFSLCPLKHPKDLETEECFAKYPLKLINGKYEFEVESGIKNFNTTVLLPAGLTCQHCVLRWHYRAGNNWGVCSPTKSGLGCGPQEVFRACSDISIS